MVRSQRLKVYCILVGNRGNVLLSYTARIHTSLHLFNPGGPQVSGLEGGVDPSPEVAGNEQASRYHSKASVPTNRWPIFLVGLRGAGD